MIYKTLSKGGAVSVKGKFVPKHICRKRILTVPYILTFSPFRDMNPRQKLMS